MDNKQHSEDAVSDSSSTTKLASAQYWLKENLFKSWQNTLLTFITAAFALYIIVTVAGFVVSNDWTVVTNNIRLLMIGQFPALEVWRIWATLIFVSVLLGLSWGIWRGVVSHIALTIAAVLFIFGAVPYTQMSSTIYLFSCVALIIGGYFVGRKAAILKIPLLILWILYIPLSLTIINGFGVVNPVSTTVWGGFFLTLVLASVAIIGSFPLGVLLAIGRRSNLPVIKYSCVVYIEFIRGIPLIMVLFIAQLILPMFLGNIEINNIFRAMIAFTLFSAAYLAENVRGGLQSIPVGQYEASQALGLSRFKLMVFIILPQALKAVIPAMVGQFISIFKDTSLVAIIGLADFLGMARRISANPEYLGRYMELYVFVAFIYFIFCYLMSHVSRHLENSLGAAKQ